MANMVGLDGNGDIKSIHTTGTGTDGDPYEPIHALPAAQVTTLTPPAAITGYALEAGHLAAIDTSTAKIPALGQALAASSIPVVMTAAEEAQLGAVTETAPTTDTASSGLNGRLQRIAQRITSLIALLPAALGAGGGLKVDGSGTALPVSGTVTANAGTNLNTSALALETGGNLAGIKALLPTALDGSGYLKIHEQGTATVDTELPAAAALADAASNPTTPTTGGAMLGFNGATWDRIRIPAISKDLSAVTITTIATVWTPGGGKKFRLMGGTISVSAACSILFEDNSAGTTIFRTPALTANAPYNFVVMGGQGILSGAADRVLKATSSAAATVTGTIWGTEE